MARIEFGYTKINDVARQHVEDCLNDNWVTMGPKTKLFEDKWAEIFQVRHACAVSSGTDALICALMALYDVGAKRGDEVIIPAISFVATLNAVLAAGFKPVLVDVHRENMLIDESKIEQVVTTNTRAIIPVTLMGLAPKMDVIRDLSDQYSLYVIVDNAEGHLCQYKNMYMEHWADMATYSCYIAHIVSATELGVVATQKSHFNEAVKSIRSHGRKNGELWFDFQRIGLNCKPTDIDCSLGLGALHEAREIFFKRKSHLAYLNNRLQKWSEYVWFTSNTENGSVSPHAMSLILKDPKHNIEDLKRVFDKYDISYKKNFGAYHTHPAFNWLAKRGDFPNAEYCGDYGIHHGVHAGLCAKTVGHISKAYDEYFEGLQWKLSQ